MIEVLKSGDVTVNVRHTKEIANQLTPSLMGYDSVKVDLTELPMDYSIRIPILVTGSGIANALDSALQKKDSAVAKAIDTYGFGKLEDITTTGSGRDWTRKDSGRSGKRRIRNEHKETDK